MSPAARPRPPGSPEGWLESARSDLRLARLGRQDREVLASQVCFHAQQCAEKALKGFLLARGLAFPLTHDLEQLLAVAEQGRLAVPEHVTAAATLTPYAVETRYPGHDEVSEAEVDEAIRIAAEVLQWAADRVADPRHHPRTG